MFITNKEAKIYTVDFGNAPRTILAHGGWAGSWELWTEPFSILSKSWRTVAYDHRGTGATISSVESITVEAMVDDIFAVMDQLGIDKCVLATESAGGVTALSAALQRPERFDGLVLVDVLYFLEDPHADTSFVQGLKTNFENTLGNFVDACVLETEPNSAEIRAWGRKILSRASQASAIKLNECIYGFDLRPQINKITLPTLIIHGDHDALVSLASSRWLAENIPNGQLHIIKDAGHVPTVTHPRVVADAINGFFGK